MKGDSSLLDRKMIQSLDGIWFFQLDPQDVGENEGWQKGGKIRERKIKVPLCWEAQFEDMRWYFGSAWYERCFVLPENFPRPDKRIILVFKAVDYLCKVWVNGQFVGEHEGGFTPFKIDITNAVRQRGENTLSLKVTDVEDISEIPHGKQTWYSRVSGIWQSVYLEERGTIFFSDIFVKPDIDKSKIRIDLELASSFTIKSHQVLLKIKINSPGGREIEWEETLSVSLSSSEVLKKTLTLNIDNPVLWDIDNPQLYRVNGYLMHGKQEVIDYASTDFGMRKIEIRNSRLYLNNYPLYIIGATDQVFNPAGIMTYLSEEDMIREIKLAKELGLNLIRKHMKCEDPRYFYWTDRLGILVWEEPPFFDTFTERSTARWEHVLGDMITRDRNHPSLIIWGLFNESWGIANVNTDSEQQRFVTQMYDKAKQLDPTRLVIDNSGGYGHDCGSYPGWYPSYHHVKTDIEDIHVYIGAPEHWLSFKNWAQKLKARGKPLIASEFGQIDLPNMDKIKQRSGGIIPWWISGEKQLHREDLGKMKGYECRFYESRLNEIYDNFTKFSNSNDWKYFMGTKYEIEEIRKNPDLSGYLLTALTDAYSEPFGLLDYFRDPKVFHSELGRIQGEDMLIVDWNRRTFWSGETFKADIIFSHYSKETIEGCELRWSLIGFDVQGHLPNVRVEECGVKKVGKIEFRAPKVERSKVLKLEVRLSKKGKLLAENYLHLFLFPRKYLEPAKSTEFTFHDPSKRASRPLSRSFYKVYRGMKADRCVVTTALDDKLLSFVNTGGRALFLPNKAQVLDDLGLTIGRPRTSYDVLYFFINPGSAIFNSLPVTNPLDWLIYRVSPHFAVGNLKSRDFEDVIMGCYSGWLDLLIDVDPRSEERKDWIPWIQSSLESNNPENNMLGGIIMRRKYGEGSLTICTLNLLPMLDDDPVASIIFNNLIS